MCRICLTEYSSEKYYYEIAHLKKYIRTHPYAWNKDSKSR